jgi:hypothetical protein
LARKNGYGINVIMSNNTQSGLPLNCGNDFKETRINPVGAVIKKVIMNGDSDSEIGGF